MSGPCCGSTSTNSLIWPPCCPANPIRLDCNDINSVIIQAILNLRGDVGSTIDEIFNEIFTLCPDLITTLPELQNDIRLAIRQGLLSWGSSATYMINGNMAKVNKANRKYWRCPAVQNSFYRCRR